MNIAIQFLIDPKKLRALDVFDCLETVLGNSSFSIQVKTWKYGMESSSSFSDTQSLKQNLTPEHFHRLNFKATCKTNTNNAPKSCTGDLLVSPDSQNWLTWEDVDTESVSRETKGSISSKRSNAVYLEDLGRLQRKHVLSIHPVPEEFSITVKLRSDNELEQMIFRLGTWCIEKLDVDGIVGVVDKFGTIGLPLEDYLARSAVSAESMLEGVDSLNRIGLLLPIKLARQIKSNLDFSNQTFMGEGKRLAFYSPIILANNNVTHFVFTDEIAVPKARLIPDGHEEVGSSWLVTEGRRKIFKENGGFGKVSEDFIWAGTINPLHLPYIGMPPEKVVLVQCPVAGFVDFHAATQRLNLREEKTQGML